MRSTLKNKSSALYNRVWLPNMNKTMLDSESFLLIWIKKSLKMYKNSGGSNNNRNQNQVNLLNKNKSSMKLFQNW